MLTYIYETYTLSDFYNVCEQGMQKYFVFFKTICDWKSTHFAKGSESVHCTDNLKAKTARVLLSCLESVGIWWQNGEIKN